MEHILEQKSISKKQFLIKYLEDYNIKNESKHLIDSKTKLFKCNMTGEEINILSNELYIKYDDGYIYKWDIFMEYINYIYSIYESNNIKLIECEMLYILDISYNCTNIKLEFCKNFSTSFHNYIKHPYHIDLHKYLIFPIYHELTEVKPYIKAYNLKYIKDYFSHGDIVYTGDNHYILKNTKQNSKKWKICNYSDEYEDYIFIPFEYIQSRGYSYYIGQSRYFDIAPLPLDILNNEIYDFHQGNIICNLDEFVDDVTTSKYYLDILDTDDNIKVDESTDIVSAYFGELVVKEGKLHAHITEETTMELPKNDIAPHFIKAKGFTYYYNVAQDCGYELMVLISPLEVLNLKTMKLKSMV